MSLILLPFFSMFSLASLGGNNAPIRINRNESLHSLIGWRKGDILNSPRNPLLQTDGKYARLSATFDHHFHTGGYATCIRRQWGRAF